MDPNQANTAVETPGNPAPSADAGSDFTLENLGANIQSAMDELADESTSAAVEQVTATTDVPGEPAAAPAAQVDETKPAEVIDEATQQRIQQENANLRTTLVKLGIDPDSNVVEDLRNGLITPDEILRAKVQAPTATSQAPAEPTTPKVPLDQKIVNFRNRVLAEGRNPTPTEYRQDMAAALDVIVDLAQANQNIQQTMEIDQNKQVMMENLNATKDAFRENVKVTLPEDVADIGQELFIATTDLAVGNLAAKYGNDKAVTPNGYRTAARTVAPKFDQFVNSIYKAGQTAMLKKIKEAHPNVNANVVNPIPPGGGGAAPSPPVDKKKFTEENLQDNVIAFLASAEAQV